MLIGYVFNSMLPIIGFLFIFRWGEEFHDVILGEQGPLSNSHSDIPVKSLYLNLLMRLSSTE